MRGAAGVAAESQAGTVGRRRAHSNVQHATKGSRGERSHPLRVKQRADGPVTDGTESERLSGRMVSQKMRVDVAANEGNTQLAVM